MQKEQEICKILKEIHQCMCLYAQKQYRPYGLTSVQFAILLELMEENHQTVSQLGAKLSMSKSNISAILQRMQAHDFIQRHKSKEDQRSVYVSLSENGKQCLMRMKQEHCDENLPFPSCSQAELTQILTGLNILYDRIKECKEYE